MCVVCVGSVCACVVSVRGMFLVCVCAVCAGMCACVDVGGCAGKGSKGE